MWAGRNGSHSMLSTVLPFENAQDRGHAQRGFSSAVHKRRLLLVKSLKFTCYHIHGRISAAFPPLRWASCHFSDGGSVSHGDRQKGCFHIYTPPLQENTAHRKHSCLQKCLTHFFFLFRGKSCSQLFLQLRLLQSSTQFMLTWKFSSDLQAWWNYRFFDFFFPPPPMVNAWRIQESVWRLKLIKWFLWALAVNSSKNSAHRPFSLHCNSQRLPVSHGNRMNPFAFPYSLTL